MSTSFVAKGDIVTVAAPYAVAAGAGCKVGDIFGVAQAAAAQGADVALLCTGIHTLTAEGAANGQDLAVGDVVYWDDTAKRCTKTSTSNMKIGVAVAAKASTATAVRVRLTDAR